VLSSSGTSLARFLSGASLSPSHARDKHEEASAEMTRKLRKIMAALVIATLVSTGALAQGKGKGSDKRPPKPPVKVIDGKGGGKPSNPPPQKPPKEGRGGKKRP
jgi:hypothetical protein